MGCGTARWRRWRSASPSAPMPASSMPERLLEALEDHRFTNISAAATHYRMMRNSGAAPRYRYALEKLSFTGEPIDSETADFAEADLRPAGLQHVRHHRDRRDPGELSRRAGFRRQARLARQADPGRRVEVHDAEGRPCAPGVIGRVEGVAPRRVDRHQGSRAASTRTDISITAAAPTMSSSRPAGP